MGLFDDIGSFLGLGGGGSSSSASVSSTVNLDVQGLDKIGVTETVELKPIEIKPLSITETVDLKPLEIKPLSITETVDLKPVSVTETVDLKPVSVTETVDLKPIALDSCQTLKLAPLPETSVCNPYRHNIAMSLFGMEFLAMTFHGESEQTIRSPRHPRVSERTSYPRRRAAPAPTVLGEGGGIRVRVVDDE